MQKKGVAEVDEHRWSGCHLHGSVPRAAGQSTIFRVPPERPDTVLSDESKTVLLPIDSSISFSAKTLEDEFRVKMAGHFTI